MGLLTILKIVLYFLNYLVDLVADGDGREYRQNEFDLCQIFDIDIGLSLSKFDLQGPFKS